MEPAQQELKRGLSFKFIVFVNSVFALLGLILGITLLVGFKQSFERQAQERGLALARNIATNHASLVSNGSRSALTAIVKELAQQPDISYASVWKSDGQLFVHSDERELGKTAKDPLTDQALRAPKAAAFEFIRGGERFYDIAVPVFQEAEATRKLGVVRIGISLENAQREFRKFLMITLTVLAILLGVGIFISLFFVQIILRPLERMTHAAVQIAGGDFTQIIGVKGRDEVGILASAFSQMSISLKGIIKKIQDTALQMKSVAGQMQANTRKVSDGAIHQAKSAEQTSSSIEQMNASVRNISENIDSLSSSSQAASSSLIEMSAAISQVAGSTNTLTSSVEDTASSLLEMSGSIKQVAGHIDSLSDSAQETSAAVTEMSASIIDVGKNAKESALLSEKVSQDAKELGIGAIEQTIEGMEKIKKTVDQSASVIGKLDERTEHIGKILTVIDEVTRQTNLLALNAAILAAQAGNEGKGFAVVADEIKSLADRTATSTKEISQLIKNVQAEAKGAVVSILEGKKRVEEGVRVSMNARESLNKILESSKRSSEMSRRIEMATLEQVKATDRVNNLMERVSTMAQQINSAMKELEKGTLNITRTSETMKSITQQVKISTEEQAKGSKQISDAVENVSIRIQQIAQAMNEQKHGNEVIRNSMVEIYRITQMSVDLAKEMSEAGEKLVDQAGALNKEVNHFKI